MAGEVVHSNMGPLSPDIKSPRRITRRHALQVGAALVGGTLLGDTPFRPASVHANEPSAATQTTLSYSINAASLPENIVSDLKETVGYSFDFFNIPTTMPLPRRWTVTLPEDGAQDKTVTAEDRLSDGTTFARLNLLQEPLTNYPSTENVEGFKNHFLRATMQLNPEDPTKSTQLPFTTTGQELPGWMITAVRYDTQTGEPYGYVGYFIEMANRQDGGLHILQAHLSTPVDSQIKTIEARALERCIYNVAVKTK